MTFATPHVFIFQVNLSSPPLNFQCSPLLGSQDTADPAFCYPKNQVISPIMTRSPKLFDVVFAATAVIVAKLAFGFIDLCISPLGIRIRF